VKPFFLRVKYLMHKIEVPRFSIPFYPPKNQRKISLKFPYPFKKVEVDDENSNPVG